jgi:hypothetical protein
MAAYGAGGAAYVSGGGGGLGWKPARVRLASSSLWAVAASRLWRKAAVERLAGSPVIQRTLVSDFIFI